MRPGALLGCCAAGCLAGLAPPTRSGAIVPAGSSDGALLALAPAEEGAGDLDGRGGAADFRIPAAVPPSDDRAGVPPGSPGGPAPPSPPGRTPLTPPPRRGVANGDRGSPATASLSNTETETSCDDSTVDLDDHDGRELLSGGTVDLDDRRLGLCTIVGTDGPIVRRGSDAATEFSVDSSGETTGLEVSLLGGKGAAGEDGEEGAEAADPEVEGPEAAEPEAESAGPGEERDGLPAAKHPEGTTPPGPGSTRLRRNARPASRTRYSRSGPSSREIQSLRAELAESRRAAESKDGELAARARWPA